MAFAMVQCCNDEEFLREILEMALEEEVKCTSWLLDAADKDSKSNAVHGEMWMTSNFIVGYASNLGFKALSCEARAYVILVVIRIHRKIK
jgi:hypothetical protein